MPLEILFFSKTELFVMSALVIHANVNFILLKRLCANKKHHRTEKKRKKEVGTWVDLNRRPFSYKSDALPTRLSEQEEIFAEKYG